jgi:hypothetical protein
MEFIKLFHLVVGGKVAAAGGIHTLSDGCSLIIGKTINAGTARLDLACHIRKFLLVLFRPGLDSLQQRFGTRTHTDKYIIFGVQCHWAWPPEVMALRPDSDASAHDSRISNIRRPSFLSSFFTALEAAISPWLA